MANAKRASMREGPLAALFRKTEERRGAPSGASAPRRAAGRERRRAPSARRRAPRESDLPHPALSARRRRERAPRRAFPRPRERLRHAFSSEIPENVMDRRRAAAR